jgi:hypothetical protein
MLRFSALLVGLLAAGPVFAQQMDADEARRFVVGKTFTFNCFEGTKGAGRIHADGSVAGTIQFRGSGPVRWAQLPPGTLMVRGDQVCAKVRGIPFEPCFNLQKTSHKSFRGAVSGLGFAYCEFNRRGPVEVATVDKDDDEPLSLRSTISSSDKR